MAQRLTLLVAGLAVALSSLTACAGDIPTRTTPTRTAQSLDPVRPGDHYVAIGDSYTAAPQTGPVAAENGCLQSTTNYPHQVAERLGLDLTDVSCGGATTQHVTNPQLVLRANRRPPQANALSTTTDLVTISLGGNDFGTYAGIVFYCAAIRGRDPAGAPCTALDDEAGKESVENRGVRIEQRLVAAIKEIKKRAPKARIVVVGYPQFFPPTGPCSQLWLAAGDYPLARRVNEMLVRAQENAAERTNAEYVDVFAATAGHDMCADDPWIAGIKPAGSDAMLYHPYPVEQQVVADLLVDLLD